MTYPDRVLSSSYSMHLCCMKNLFINIFEAIHRLHLQFFTICSHLPWCLMVLWSKVCMYQKTSGKMGTTSCKELKSLLTLTGPTFWHFGRKPGGFMIPLHLEMCMYFMDGLFSEDKYWVTSTNYEPMMAKSLILCIPNSNPYP